METMAENKETSNADSIYISTNLSENIMLLKEKIPIGKSFDLITREIQIGSHMGYYVLINGLINSNMVLRLFQRFQSGTETVGVESLESFIQIQLGNTEVTKEKNLEKIITAVLSGYTVLFVDGFSEAMILDMRSYPTRSPEEPDLEKVTRGSRDGMVETIVFNTALVRRRVRDPNLVYEIQKIGSRSHTDVAIGYINGLADEKLVQHIKETLKNIKTEALVMGEKTLEEREIAGKVKEKEIIKTKESCYLKISTTVQKRRIPQMWKPLR